MKPKFSIAISAYKSKFLSECIKSILDQTINDFELIILNDASPEPIPQIIKGFSDDKIRYYENIENVGAEKIVDNWNFCLRQAQGEFFCIIGDDDKLEPNFLEVYLRLIEKYPNSDVYHCRSLIIDENSKPLYFTPSWPESESVYDNIWHRINNFRMQFVGDFLYRTEYLKLNGGYYYLPLAWASDDITSYIVMKLNGIKHINIPIFNYRINSQTLTNTGSVISKLKAVNIEHSWYSDFLKFKPTEISDRILHSSIENHLNIYIMKKKIRVIAFALEGKSLLGKLQMVLKVKREYASKPVLIYGCVEYIRHLLARINIKKLNRS